MKELQQLLTWLKDERAKAAEFKEKSKKGKDFYGGQYAAFDQCIVAAELLLINNARKQSPESPIAQTPCKAKVASEANDLPS